MRIPTLGEPLVPEGAVKVTDARGQACAIAFQRPGAKPAWCQSFPSAKAREARIRSLFEAYAQAIAAKAERKATRLKPHRLQEGHILCSTWGYEQTNVNFYQVIRLIGRNTVELRELCQVIQSGEHWATGKAMPSDDSKATPSPDASTAAASPSASTRTGQPPFGMARRSPGRPTTDRPDRAGPTSWCPDHEEDCPQGSRRVAPRGRGAGSAPSQGNAPPPVSL